MAAVEDSAQRASICNTPKIKGNESRHGRSLSQDCSWQVPSSLDKVRQSSFRKSLPKITIPKEFNLRTEARYRSREKQAKQDSMELMEEFFVRTPDRRHSTLRRSVVASTRSSRLSVGTPQTCRSSTARKTESLRRSLPASTDFGNASFLQDSFKSVDASELDTGCWSSAASDKQARTSSNTDVSMTMGPVRLAAMAALSSRAAPTKADTQARAPALPQTSWSRADKAHVSRSTENEPAEDAASDTNPPSDSSLPVGLLDDGMLLMRSMDANTTIGSYEFTDAPRQPLPTASASFTGTSDIEMYTNEDISASGLTTDEDDQQLEMMRQEQYVMLNSEASHINMAGMKDSLNCLQHVAGGHMSAVEVADAEVVSVSSQAVPLLYDLKNAHPRLMDTYSSLGDVPEPMSLSMKRNVKSMTDPADIPRAMLADLANCLEEEDETYEYMVVESGMVPLIPACEGPGAGKAELKTSTFVVTPVHTQEASLMSVEPPPTPAAVPARPNAIVTGTSTLTTGNSAVMTGASTCDPAIMTGTSSLHTGGSVTAESDAADPASSSAAAPVTSSSCTVAAVRTDGPLMVTTVTGLRVNTSVKPSADIPPLPHSHHVIPTSQHSSGAATPDTASSDGTMLPFNAGYHIFKAVKTPEQLALALSAPKRKADFSSSGAFGSPIVNGSISGPIPLTSSLHNVSYQGAARLHPSPTVLGRESYVAQSVSKVMAGDEKDPVLDTTECVVASAAGATSRLAGLANTLDTTESLDGSIADTMDEPLAWTSPTPDVSIAPRTGSPPMFSTTSNSLTLASGSEQPREDDPNAEVSSAADSAAPAGPTASQGASVSERVSQDVVEVSLAPADDSVQSGMEEEAVSPCSMLPELFTLQASPSLGPRTRSAASRHTPSPASSIASGNTQYLSPSQHLSPYLFLGSCSSQECLLPRQKHVPVVSAPVSAATEGPHMHVPAAPPSLSPTPDPAASSHSAPATQVHAAQRLQDTPPAAVDILPSHVLTVDTISEVFNSAEDKLSLLTTTQHVEHFIEDFDAVIHASPQASLLAPGDSTVFRDQCIIGSPHTPVSTTFSEKQSSPLSAPPSSKPDCSPNRSDVSGLVNDQCMMGSPITPASADSSRPRESATPEQLAKMLERRVSMNAAIAVANERYTHQQPSPSGLTSDLQSGLTEGTVDWQLLSGDIPSPSHVLSPEGCTGSHTETTDPALNSPSVTNTPSPAQSSVNEWSGHDTMQTPTATPGRHHSGTGSRYAEVEAGCPSSTSSKSGTNAATSENTGDTWGSPELGKGSCHEEAPGVEEPNLQKRKPERTSSESFESRPKLAMSSNTVKRKALSKDGRPVAKQPQDTYLTPELGGRYAAISTDANHPASPFPSTPIQKRFYNIERTIHSVPIEQKFFNLPIEKAIHSLPIDGRYRYEGTPWEELSGLSGEPSSQGGAYDAPCSFEESESSGHQQQQDEAESQEQQQQRAIPDTSSMLASVQSDISVKGSELVIVEDKEMIAGPGVVHRASRRLGLGPSHPNYYTQIPLDSPKSRPRSSSLSLPNRPPFRPAGTQNRAVFATSGSTTTTDTATLSPPAASANTPSSASLSGTTTATSPHTTSSTASTSKPIRCTGPTAGGVMEAGVLGLLKDKTVGASVDSFPLQPRLRVLKGGATPSPSGNNSSDSSFSIGVQMGTGPVDHANHFHDALVEGEEGALLDSSSSGENSVTAPATVGPITTAGPGITASFPFDVVEEPMQLRACKPKFIDLGDTDVYHDYQPMCPFPGMSKPKPKPQPQEEKVKMGCFAPFACFGLGLDEPPKEKVKPKNPKKLFSCFV